MTTTTSINRSEIAELVMDGLRDTLEINGNSVAGISEETYLIGRDAVLDSMGLVTLVVDLEQQVEDEFNAAIVLADERAMSQRNSPFRSIGSLADYICRLIEEQNQT
jgi:acyl carrier protein